jgi:hypothetical protein
MDIIKLVHIKVIFDFFISFNTIVTKFDYNVNSCSNSYSEYYCCYKTTTKNAAENIKNKSAYLNSLKRCEPQSLNMQLLRIMAWKKEDKPRLSI